MMAATATRLSSSPAFDDHASLDASLEDFRSNDRRSPPFGLPSQHSGFRSSEEEPSEEDEDAASEEPWSPPAWRNTSAAAGWYRHQPYPQDSPKAGGSKSILRSREASHESYESAVEEDEDSTKKPADIPLPRGSQSPMRHHSPLKQETRSPSPHVAQDSNSSNKPEEVVDAISLPENNYFRFALRAEVQQRTEPIEAALSLFRAYYSYATKSWASMSSTIMLLSMFVGILRLLTHTPQLPPSPDLVKVAGLARSFEPLIFYSENGVRQIGDLQETGVAVWDLGESVRHANMTSTPLIVTSLDSLSDSLKSLAVELTKFFANVDGDIDGILIVMDWAKRELAALSLTPHSTLSSAFTNVHSLLSYVGVLESRSTGIQTPIGKLFTTFFGATRAQRTHYTLHRTFNEFLSVLEDSINTELTHSTALFALFETIDRQFLNLQRTVIRESDTQEREENEVLSSLWTRLVGASPATLKKYEKNRQLLASVRAKTTMNKHALVEHNGRLMALKGNLEALRRKLMSPLVRRQGGSTLSVEEQVRGLEGTESHLRRVREGQRGRVLEVLYGAGAGVRRSSIGTEEAVQLEG